MIWINMALSVLRSPEMRKKPGVHYASTDDGVELPILDVTHPAFDFETSDVALEGAIASFVRDTERRRRLPRVLEKLVLGVFLRKSVLAGALRRAQGGFLAGVATYLFKLGPDLLGEAYTQPIDKKIAASLPALSMRLRLLDMARLVAEGVTPALEARRSRLELVNLGGGPSADSWNALLLLARDRPELLGGREVRIRTLDRDEHGPAFGARAIEVLRGPDAPLAGVDVSLTRAPYDWSEPRRLGALLGASDAEPPVVAVSSEGALFEYASDEDVVANLEALRASTPGDAIVVGSVTSDSEIAAMILESSQVPLRPRSRDAFERLAARGGFRIDRLVERPTCRDVRLVKR
jgi:hypothetical protein